MKRSTFPLLLLAALLLVTQSSRAIPADTIPITFSHGRILMPVDIEGHTHRFVFDTGCSCGLLFTDEAFALKKGGLFSFTFVGDAAGHVKLTKKRSIPLMRLGHTEVKKYRVIVSPPTSMMRQDYDCQDIVGCIGSDLFKKKAVKIDIRRGEMVVSDDASLFADEAGFRIPFKTDLHVPYVMVKTRRDREREYMLDTGFPGYITVRKKDLEQIDTLTTATGATNAGIYGKTADQLIARVKLDSISIGGCVFRDITTNVQPSNTSSIGSLFLKYGSLVIDYRHREMIFRPYEYAGGITVGNQYNQVVLMFDGKHYKVTLVWEDSKAWQQGVRVGDRLTHIDGINVEDNPCAYFNLDMTKKHVLTLVADDGKVVEFEI